MAAMGESRMKIKFSRSADSPHKAFVVTPLYNGYGNRKQYGVWIWLPFGCYLIFEWEAIAQ